MIWKNAGALFKVAKKTVQKNTFSVTVRGGIGDFIYKIILQSLFMTKKYELKNISIFVMSWAESHFKCVSTSSYK